MADGTTVRPDGVIRVARGGRTWTALLETKTGTNGHRRNQQVEGYRTPRASRSTRAAATLSNELTPIGGAHPLAVDKRKTQKVALHQSRGRRSCTRLRCSSRTAGWPTTCRRGCWPN